MQPIRLFPASAKHNSPVFGEMPNEFGKLTAGADNKISLSVPSKLDHSIFGLSRFQSDQYNLLQIQLDMLVRGVSFASKHVFKLYTFGAGRQRCHEDSPAV